MAALQSHDKQEVDAQEKQVNGKRNQELETENKTHRQTSKQKHRKADIHTDNVWMWS